MKGPDSGMQRADELAHLLAQADRETVALLNTVHKISALLPESSPAQAVMDRIRAALC